MILEKYLNDRNSLVHSWDEISDWEREETAIAFTIGVQKQAAYLAYTFIGFSRAWMEQVDMSHIDEDFPELEEFFAEVDRKWKPLIHEVIEEVKNTKENMCPWYGIHVDHGHIKGSLDYRNGGDECGK